jgi:hypothetical protein
MTETDEIPPIPDIPWEYDQSEPQWTHGENGLAAICHPDAQNRLLWRDYTRYFDGEGDVPIDIVLADWRDDPEAVVERMERVFHPEILRDTKN